MSPIRGLSDRGLAFPEIGQIRKGDKKTDNAPGKDLTYFRVDFDEQEKEAIASFSCAYPTGKPTDLNIVLPFNEIDQVWDAWLEGYTAGRLVCRADGEKIIYLVDTKTGDILVKNGVDVITNKERPYTAGMTVGYDYQNKPIKCKATGRLKVVLPELQRLAYLTVLTGSLHDIANLSAQLLAIQTFCAGMGKGLGGTPLVLRRRPHNISCPDAKEKGKRVRRTKWLLSIEADPEYVKRALLETKRLALPGNGLALPEPENITGPAWDAIDDGEGEEEITGETTETTPETTAAPDPRPWSAQQVKARVQELVAEYTSKPCTASDYDRKVLAATLDTTFKGDKTMRYLLTRWLLDVGDGSTKDLTPPQVRALMMWQGVKRFDDVPSADAVTETNSAYTAALEASGQSKLL